MIRIAPQPKPATPEWHEVFLRLLPTIRQHARISFRHLDADRRTEAIQAVICNACAATARLAALGKLDLAYAGPLARFGVAQVKTGRMTGGHLNCKDVLSRYCQQRKEINVERLDRFDEDENAWAEAVVEDTRTSTVPEIVAFRCDFSDWLASLSRRDRHIAESLAIGNRTSDVAQRFDVSAGRVSQLRREFSESWKAFVGDAPAADADPPTG
jgi:DNA-binding CsgD family transcriptional regulator